MTAGYDAVELPQFTRRIAITDGFDAEHAGHQRVGPGVLGPFAGVLGLGIATGDWPAPALAHLVLQPLVADTLAESATPPGGATETVRRTVVDRTSGVEPTPGGTTDERTSDAESEPRVRDLLRGDAGDGRTAGDGADDEESFREIVERVSADARGDRDRAGSADPAVPPRMDVASSTSAGDDVRAPGDPGRETGSDRERTPTRSTDATPEGASTTDAPADATSHASTTPATGDSAAPATDESADPATGESADAVDATDPAASPERPADGETADESAVSPDATPSQPSDARPPEPPEMTVKRDVARVADESDDGASAGGPDGRAAADESTGRTTPAGSDEGGQSPGESDGATPAAGDRDGGTATPGTVAPGTVAARSITRLPGPPSMTLQRSVTGPSSAGSADGVPPSARPGRSSRVGSSPGGPASDDASSTAGPGVGSPGRIDRVARTVLADPVAAGPGGANGAGNASRPGAAGEPGDASGPGSSSGPTGDLASREALPTQSDVVRSPGGDLTPSSGGVRLETLAPDGRSASGNRVGTSDSPADTPARGSSATSSPRMSVRKGRTDPPGAAEQETDDSTATTRERPARDGIASPERDLARRPLERFLDVDRLADRLYREFERKLRIERERRGL